MKAPLGPLEDAQGRPYLANRIAQNLAASTQYRDVSPQDAQTIGNAGHLVIAAWFNPVGPGHVVTVRPAGVPGDIPVGRSGPLLNDIGREDRVARQSMAFQPADQVHYCTPSEAPGGQP